VAALAAILIGVLGDSDETSGEHRDSPDDPTAPGTLRLEIGGDAPETHPTKEAGEIEPPPHPVDPPPPPPEPETHLVREGESLRGLARKYYGDPERWTDIQRANGIRGTVIQAGQTLVIPR